MAQLNRDKVLSRPLHRSKLDVTSSDDNMGVSSLVVNAVIFLLDFYVFLVKALFALLSGAYHKVRPAAPKSIKGEVAVVTGAGRGIGRQLSYELARRGAKVVCLDINQETNAKTVEYIKSIGYSAFAFQCDISQRSEVADIARQIRNEVGRPRLVINNANIKPCHPLLNHNVLEIQRNISVNLLSHFWTLYEFLPHMITSGNGHVVAIASFAATFDGVPNLVPYCAAKTGVTGLMKALKTEVLASSKNANVTFTTVHLGFLSKKHEKSHYKYPWLVGRSDVKYAGDKIIEAILLNKEEVYIPRVGFLLQAVWGLLPCKIHTLIYDFLGLIPRNSATPTN